MKAQIKVVMALCAVLLFHTAVQAGEYFVNKRGNDANSGQAKEQAFLTIQKGVNALNPGDTLTVGPGEYLENVKRTGVGSADVDTLIRAEVPGTAVLRGDIPAHQFKKVDGYRFVYAAPCDQKPQAVLEHDTLRVVQQRANVPELELDPGYFHYDAAAKMLYLSRADLRSPEQRLYTVAVNGNSGLELINPRRVTIEGIAATGFFPGWGICLTAPVSCVVRDCVLFMNVGGVVLQPAENAPGNDGGSGNVVEGCTCYGNSFGGVVRYYANNDIVRNCYNYKNVSEGSEHFGVMHYFDMPGPLLIQNNISWGHNFDFSVKPGPQQEKLENCVGLGHIRIAPESMVHNLFDGSNEYGGRGDMAGDTVLFNRERDLDRDEEYADAANLDFRLQPGSRFRGSAPDKTDRGPYQYEANIFYLSPAGNDEADGRSLRTPWRTLERAVKGLRPGDTLYLSKGEYAGVTWENAAGAEKPINVRGRGRDPVTITGRMALTGGAGVMFERLSFPGALALNGSADIAFKNCVFSGTTDGLSVESVKGLRLTHGVFAGAPIILKNSSGVFLSGNLYANSGKPAVQLDADTAILYSDYNSYKDAAACWQVADATLSLSDLQKRHDLYSLVIDPQLAQEGGATVLKNEFQFAGCGPNGTTPGVYLEYKPGARALAVDGPFLHLASDTTADIEWWSSAPATYALAWGETPEMTQRVPRYSGQERFNTFSLTGLKPNQKYYFKITSAISGGQDAAKLESESAQISFMTAAAAAEPRVYFVAPDGNDGNSGLGRDQAFRTVNYAAARVGPGDTIMIAGGDYNERVRIRAAGTKERPITLRSIPGEQATFRGENLSRAFDVILKPDYRFDGLYFRGRDFFSEGFVVRQSDRVQFTRCLNASIAVNNSAEVLIRNCVLQGYWNAVELSGCPNSIVENNVFSITILRQLNAGSSTIARNNIFCECIRGKTHQTLLDINLGNVKESNNCFYLRWPVEEKLAVDNMPLPVYRIKTGSDSFAANPMMPGMPGQLEGWQLSSDRDFNEFFTTNPQLVARGIGLQPEAFSEFGMEVEKWPFTRAWAEKVIKDIAAAGALVKAGKDSTALAAYTELAANTPMGERLKADVMEQASLCAERLKKYELAMQLAKDIPVQPMAVRRQMQIMLARKQYAALLDAFADDKMGGLKFFNGFLYPELEDLMGDLYYYRSIAYRETGDLAAAEADLKVMNDKRALVQYSSGEAIHDLAWLRLGDFYRDYLKDDNKALAAYLNVCNRMTWWPFESDTIDKPVSTGANETLVAATKSACEILTRQGKTEDAGKLQADLLKAQRDAAEALRK